MKYMTKQAAGPAVRWINPKRFHKVMGDVGAFHMSNPSINNKQLNNLFKDGKELVDTVAEGKKKGGLIVRPKMKVLDKNFNPDWERAIGRHELFHWMRAQKPRKAQKMQRAGITAEILGVPGAKSVRNAGQFIEEFQAYTAMKPKGHKFKSKVGAASYNTGVFQTVGAIGSTKGWSREIDAIVKGQKKKLKEEYRQAVTDVKTKKKTFREAFGPERKK